MEVDQPPILQANRDSIRLRDFLPEDLPAMHTLDQICFRKGISYSLAEMSQLMRPTTSRCLIAVAGREKLVGFAVMERGGKGGDRWGHIISIDVDPEYRRRGIGLLLMQSLERELLAEGARHCALEVAIDDEGAQTFYSHLGYRPTTRLPGYYLGILDAMAMRKDLHQKP